MTPTPIRRRPDGIELAVKVTARAGRDRIEGVVLDAAGVAWLSVKVAAPAEGGKANLAVAALLAKALGIPAAAVRLAGGARSRWKRFDVAGEPERLAARASALCDGAAAMPARSLP